MGYIVNTATVKSRYHEINEDNSYSSNSCIIIADGMGGESSGEVASSIAVDTISSSLKVELTNDMSDDRLKQLTDQAILKADNDIISYMTANPGSYGMGTTVVIAVRQGRHLFVSWCGDSRCYVFNCGSNSLRCITKDHSYVQDLIDKGEITIEQSYSHPESNVITRYVGGGESMCISDYTSCMLSADDIVVVCSDGLSGYCLDKSIEQKLGTISDREDLSNILLEFALENGSDDDITIVTMMDEALLCKVRKSLFSWFKGK